MGASTGEARSRHLPWIDGIGAILAMSCAVHCFVFMLGSMVLGFTAPNLFLSPSLRWLMVFLLAAMSAGSLMAHGRHYGLLPAWLMAGGVTAICAANLMGFWSLTGDMLCQGGGLIMAAGHLLHMVRAKRTHRPERGSPRLGLPRKMALLLPLAVSMLALFQLLPVLVHGGEPKADQDEVPPVGWRVLAQLDVRTGEIGPDLRAVVGKTVRIPGFIVPLSQNGKEFLLAPHVGACIHGPTPPTNQIVYVTLQEGVKPVDPWSWEPIWVTGTLEVMVTQSPYGSVGFDMKGTSTKIYR